MVMLFKSTQFGRQVRAVAADRETAQLCAVPVGRLSIISFGIAGALAGLAGVLIAPVGGIDLHFGFLIMLGGFYAAILGGFGSLGGVVVGGFMIGFVQYVIGSYWWVELPAGAAVHPADRHHRREADGPVHQGADAWPPLR